MNIPQHPFAELVDLRTEAVAAGRSTLALDVGPQHLNPHGVLHGAMLYALADTGMGAALYTTLAPDELCTTIEIKIGYFRPVQAGRVVCETGIVHRGRRIAHLESRLRVDGALVAQANGSFAILERRAPAA